MYSNVMYEIAIYCATCSPVVYVALVVAHSNSDIAHFGEVKGRIVLVVVRSDPADPHTRGLLASKDPHRVVILK